MKQFLHTNARKLLMALAITFFTSAELLAQAQPMVIYDPNTGAGTNIFPFNSATSNRRAWIYSPSDFTNAQPGFITRIYILASANVNPVFTNLQISMGPSATPTWTSFASWPTTGMTPVINAATFAPVAVPYPGPTTGTWMAFDLQTPYLFDNVTSFIVDAQQFGYSPGFSVRQATVTNGSIYGSATGNPTNFQSLKAIFGFDWIPAGPCTSPPVIGATTASNTQVCIGNTTNLSVDTLTFGSGQTFMWQNSLDGINWANMPNDTLTSTTVTIIDTIFYRLGATCSGITSYSTPIRIDAVGTPLPGGTYTINSLLPTGGANFASLTDFANFITCGGISGPIVLNVVPGTGPYTGQVIFDNINTTAVNTITINGNGELQTFSGGITTERATIHLKGTSFVTIDSLDVEVGSTATFGYTIQLSNGASNVTIKNSTLLGNLSSTSTNFATLVIGAGATPTATGTGLSSDITIENNNIIGGFYGITIIGGGSTNRALNNKILNNNITDYYLYGVFSNSQEDFVYSRNDISRPLRSTLSTHYGLYFTQQHVGGVITKNAIHDPFGGLAAPTTSLTYGMFATSASATPAKRTLVANNIFYNLRNNGSMYAIYNSTTSDWVYHHNTIDIDDLLPTAGLTYAVYFLGTSDSVTFTNNVVSLRRTGTSAKYAIYITGSGAKTINNNGYFVDYQVGSSSFGFLGSAQATISDWRTTTGHDLNSVFDNPGFVFSVGGLLQPSTGSYDNIGQNLLSLVPDDYLDSTRTITPDPGAFEFQGPPCSNPVAFDTSAVTPTSIGLVWTQPGITNQWDLEWGPVGFTPGTTGSSTATITANPHTITGLTPGGCYDVYIRANCVNLGQGTGPWVGPVSACLPYAFDVELKSLISPSVPVGCGDSSMAITFVIGNNGLNPVGNFPINVAITGTFTQTFNYTYVGPLAPGAVDTVTAGTLNTFAGGSMNLSITSQLATDQNITNDTLNRTGITIAPGLPTVLPAFACANQDSLTLAVSPIPGLTYSWFDVATGGTAIQVGDSLRIPTNTTSNFWVEYGAGSGAAGGDSLDFTFAAGNGQSGNQFDINALKPLEILGFTISPQGSGTATVEIYHKVGTYVGSETNQSAWTLVEAITFTNTGTPTRVNFTNSLTIPQGVNAFYVTLTSGSVNYTNGTTVGTLLNSNADLQVFEGIGMSYAFGSIFTPRVFNGRIHYGMPGGACSSPRVPVPFTVHTDTAFATFVSNQTGPGDFTFDATGSVGNIFEWSFGDGGTATGITTSHTYNAGNTYPVTLIVRDTICNTVDSVTINVTSTVSVEDFLLNNSLKVYPNPSADLFHVEVSLEGVKDLYIRIVSPTGQLVFEDHAGKSAGQYKKTIDLGKEARGFYLLQVQTEKGLVTRKLILGL
jgi:hypothetical protein